MFDIKWIKENPNVFDEGMRLRGNATTAADLLKLDDVRKEHIARLQEAQTRRNAASKEIGAAMGKGDKDLAEKLKAEVADIKALIQSGEEEERRIASQITDVMSAIPNVPLDGVPEGDDEDDNALYRLHGEKPKLDFEAKEHFEITKA